MEVKNLSPISHAEQNSLKIHGRHYCQFCNSELLGEVLQDPGKVNCFLGKTPKPTKTEAKTGKWDYIKLRK